MSQAAQTPLIVASGSMLGQTSGLSATLFTPSAAGMFRISAYFEGNVSNLNAEIQYSDDEGSQGVGQNGFPWGASVVLRSAAGAPIKMLVSIPTGVVNPSFNVYYVVEALQ